LAKEVLTRFSAGTDWLAANEGDDVVAGSRVRTGAESKVRLDFTEGTIVRLGSFTEFTVTGLRESLDDPFTRLKLAAGQVWVILMGGQLEVETPAGVATVRGSYLGVSYQPETKTVVVTCLEGQCTLRNGEGEVKLTDGQTSTATDDGLPPSPPAPMLAEQVAAWVTASPEAETIMRQVYPQGTPTPIRENPIAQPSLPPTLTPAARVNVQPLKYSLTHNCPPDPQSGASREGIWHWTFENVTIGQTFTVSVNPGSTERGELPPGHYRISDRDNTGPLESGELDSDSATIFVIRCPKP
jgi:hypothetical protein